MSADIAWVARGDFCEPETVLPLPDNTLLVSNVCGFSKTGNGYLSLLNSKGEAIDWRIVDKLDAPLGMARVNDRLYIVDSNRLRILAWPSYTPITMIELGTTVANDVAVTAGGTAFVTDTAKHSVLKVAPDGSQTLLTATPQFQGANGIALDDEYLLVGGERLWQVDLKTNVVETLGPTWLTDIDGIEIEANGTLQVTPVGGALIRYNRTDKSAEIYSGNGVSSANHGYSQALELALIPTGFDNTVIAIRVRAPAP
ncbi:MAG: hypothetical protein AAGC71_11585 [Pseudomonadota bacterium]